MLFLTFTAFFVFGSVLSMSAYWELLESVRASVCGVRESGAITLPDELQLQALWFAGQMGREFRTLDGRFVKIVQFGHWNHSAGPDFLHASVEVDGELLSGSLELDHRFSDWEAHGHAQNEAFNDVVLHVVFADEGRTHFTRTADHREVSQVVVSDEQLRDALNLPLAAVADAHPGRCLTPLVAMNVEDLDCLLWEAAKHRVSMKARRQSRTAEVLGEDECLWQGVAETLGYRPNRLAMTLVAQRLPVGELLAKRDDGNLAEAVLFGAAGFLTAESYEQADTDSQKYLRELWESWWRLRDDYEPVPSRQIPWSYSGIRPVNHPQRRLSCLAMVLKNWQRFKKSCRDFSANEEFFEDLDHPYWGCHYTLKSKRSERRLALMGRERVRDFQINHLLPSRLASDDKVAWEFYLKIPAPVLSEKVNKASLRLFGDSPRRKTYLRKAWQHQALLQIYQDFCLRDVSDCVDCPFPEQLAQWKA